MVLSSVSVLQLLLECFKTFVKVEAASLSKQTHVTGSRQALIPKNLRNSS